MKSPRRRSVLALLGISAAGAACLPLLTMAVGAGPLAPDLRADPVRGVEQPQEALEAVNGGQPRLLVRFDGFVTNVGQGPIEISGNPQITSANDNAGLRQRASSTIGGPVDQVVGRPPVYYESADGHNHFHLKSAMRYSLWNSSETAMVAPGSKVGFCLYDIEQVFDAPVQTAAAVYTQPVTLFCDQGNPSATSLKMGTSPGWRDLYDKSLPYQWVDVSDTAPGVYHVASEADPDDLLWEGGGSAETNARGFSSSPVTIPGWVAKPITTPQAGGAQTIAFQTTKFGSQPDSNLRFTIVDPPDHGTLDQPTGTPFSAGSVKYTPAPGFGGPDSFTYSASYSGYGYPRNPPTAAVSLTTAAPSITISGAPASVIAGTSAQLTANLANVTGGVSWSTTAGSVSPTGLFTAPGAVPAGGSVTVTAKSAATPGISTSVTITIAPVPPQTPAPSVNVTPPSGAKLLSELGARHVGARIIVGKVVVGPKSGTLRFTATIGKKVLGRCLVKAPARRAVTCKIVLRRNYNLRKVRFTAQLKFAKTAIVRRGYVVKG